MRKGFQIQAWPTIEIFVSGEIGPREVQDSEAASVALSTFTNVQPQYQTVVEDQIPTGRAALTTFTTVAPLTRTTSETEPPSGRVAMTAFVMIAPIIETNSESEPPKTSVALSSFVLYTPQSRTVSDDNNGGVALTTFTKV